jgi:hypothetical protein
LNRLIDPKHELTYTPTAQELCQALQLELIEVELEPHEQPQRLIYGHPRFRAWMENVLPNLAADGFFAGAPSPREQVDALLHRFIAGYAIQSFPPKCIKPEHNGVWELRTYDVRVFGWFWRRGVFIASHADTKSNCKGGLYPTYRNGSVSDRNLLDLDPPKFITGVLNDVL